MLEGSFIIRGTDWGFLDFRRLVCGEDQRVGSGFMVVRFFCFLWLASGTISNPGFPGFAGTCSLRVLVLAIARYQAFFFSFLWWHRIML